MRRYASYPTYSSVHPAGLISRVRHRLSDATPCVLSDLQFSSPRRPDKSRQRRIRHRLSDATPYVLSDLQFSTPRRPDKPRQRRIRHRLSDATLCVLSDLQFSSPRRPDKPRQRRIRHRLSDATLCVLSDLQFSSSRRPDKPRQRRIRHRLSNTTNGRFLFRLATGKQVVELLFVLVIVDAFVQFVAGLHGVDDAFLRAFLTQDVVDMFGGAVHGAKR